MRQMSISASDFFLKGKDLFELQFIEIHSMVVGKAQEQADRGKGDLGSQLHGVFSSILRGALRCVRIRFFRRTVLQPVSDTGDSLYDILEAQLFPDSSDMDIDGPGLAVKFHAP